MSGVSTPDPRAELDTNNLIFILAISEEIFNIMMDHETLRSHASIQ